MKKLTIAFKNLILFLRLKHKKNRLSLLDSLFLLYWEITFFLVISSDSGTFHLKLLTDPASFFWLQADDS